MTTDGSGAKNVKYMKMVDFGAKSEKSINESVNEEKYLSSS